MNLRAKVAVELGAIAVLTTIFLLLFPKRSPAVDVALAGFSLLCVALSVRYTKKVIWAASPPPIAQHRFKRCVIVILWVTVPAVLLFLSIGVFFGYQHGGWPAVAERVFN